MNDTPHEERKIMMTASEAMERLQVRAAIEADKIDGLIDDLLETWEGGELRVPLDEAPTDAVGTVIVTRCRAAGWTTEWTTEPLNGDTTQMRTVLLLRVKEK